MLADTLDSLSSNVIKQEVNLFEVFAADNGAFRRTLFTYVDKNERAWAGEVHNIRKYDLTDEDIRTKLQLVPEPNMFPELIQGVTLLDPDLDIRKLFFKRPQIHALFEEFGGSIVPQLLLEEVQVMEFLARHPHPNIVPYHGYMVRRGRITGITLTRYSKTLEHRFFDDASDIDLDRFERLCRDATSRIHDLGLAHNDLNPSNIALCNHDDPVIIDRGSCKEFGGLLLSAGTSGWMEDDFDVPRKEHDLFALDRIMALMREKKVECAKGVTRPSILEPQ
nr:hypothetical protein CFP56_20606 [Quercus suber]